MSSILQYALAGRGFFGTTAAAGVTPVGIGTSPLFGLWNPAGSGVNTILSKFTAAAVTLGTSIVSGFGLYRTANAGASIGTAAPIVAFNDVASNNMLVGGGFAARSRFCSAATTTTAANPTFLMALPMAQSAAAAGPMADQAVQFDFGGTLILPPGNAVFVFASSTNTTAYQMTLSWVELPVS